MFCKKGAVRNLTKFTGKHLWLRPATLLRKESLTQMFSCEFCEILRTPSFTDHLRWLLLLQLVSDFFKGIMVNDLNNYGMVLFTEITA